ncbi:glycogen debranching N-terminal domain-containing protein, partial [Actinoallomurus acaciae]
MSVPASHSAGVPGPALHEYLTCVAAPATWLSPPDGRLTGGPGGLYVADRRVLSRLVVTLDGAEPEPRGAETLGADRVRFTAARGAL